MRSLGLSILLLLSSCSDPCARGLTVCTVDADCLEEGERCDTECGCVVDDAGP